VSSRAEAILEKLHASESGVHAILLYGPRGAGKSELVHKLVTRWLANERAIQAYQRGTNPDVLIVQPKGGSRNIRLGQITDTSNEDDKDEVKVLDFVRTRPLYSDHKVVWIKDCDRLVDDAANALLKSLEEPIPHVRYILTSTFISRIRQTILSRCLVLACELPAPPEDINTLSPDDQLLWELAEHAPGVFNEMRENPDLYLPFILFANELVVAPPESILGMSSRFRDIADAFEEKLKLGARVSNSRCVELLAVAISRWHGEHTQTVSALVDAHKRIIGNASAGLVFDATFAKILVK
jgi:hypothetical protein